MKYFAPILILLILITGCASNNGESFKLSDETPRSNSSLRLEPRIVHTNKSEEQNEDEEPISAKDFDIIAQHKIQQFLDMTKISGINSKDYKEYINRHADKLWFNPEKAKKTWQQLNFNTADSIKITNIKLLNFKEAGTNENIGTYQIGLKVYRHGHLQKINKKAQIYFEIIDLPINDKIYKTIKAKILSLQ